MYDNHMYAKLHVNSLVISLCLLYLEINVEQS